MVLGLEAANLVSGSTTLSNLALLGLGLLAVGGLLFGLWSTARFQKERKVAERARRYADDAVRAVNLLRNIGQDEVFDLIRKGSYPDVDTLMKGQQKGSRETPPPPLPPPLPKAGERTEGPG